MNKRALSLFALLIGVVPFAVTAQCAETHVDNATMIFPADLPEIEGGEDITVRTKKNNVCVSEATGTNSAFATAVRGDDEVITPDVIDGATSGEEMLVRSGEKSVLVEFSDGPDDIASKSEPTYEDGAIYEASSFKALPPDSNDIDLSTDTLYTAEDSADVGISVTLPAADTLTGVQFDVKYDGPKPRIIKDYDAGEMLTSEVGSSKIRVVIYTPNGNSLPKDGVAKIRADVTPEGQSISLKRTFATVGFLDNVTEVRLKVGQSPVFIQEGAASLVVNTTSVDHGEVLAGSTATEPIEVVNEGTLEGSVSASIDNGLFSVPSETTVPAGDTTQIPVTFGPTRTQFGAQTADASLSISSSPVPVEGIGIGGRGDPTLSGTVDVSDVALIADIILEIYSPNNPEFAAADVLPVDTEGDGFVRIGDLQGTQGAVLNGSWGDGAPLFGTLQKVNAQTRSLSKRRSQSSKILLKETEGGVTEIYVVGAKNLQGVQMDIDRPVKVQKRDGITVQGRPTENGTRVITYKQGIQNLPGDSLHVATIGDTKEADVETAIGTDQAYNSISLDVDRQEVVSENALEVYPNPIRSRGDVSLSLENETEGTLEVLDLLGRTVRTVRKGRFGAGRKVYRLDASGIASGLYLVRFRSEGYTSTKKMTVVK